MIRYLKYIKIILILFYILVISTSAFNYNQNKLTFFLLLLFGLFILVYVILYYKTSLRLSIKIANFEAESQNQFGFLIADLQGNTIYVGDTFKKITMYGVSENINFLNWLEDNAVHKKFFLESSQILKRYIDMELAYYVVLATPSRMQDDLILHFFPVGKYLLFKVGKKTHEYTSELDDYLKYLPAGFLATSLSGDILVANENFFTLINISREEFFANNYSFSDFIIDTEKLDLDDEATFWEEGTSGRVKIKPISAPSFWVWMFQNKGTDFFGNTKYIRSLLVPELENKSSTDIAENVIWKSPIATVMIDEKSNIVKVNDTFKDLIGNDNIKTILDFIPSNISLNLSNSNPILTVLRNGVFVKITSFPISKKRKIMYIENLTLVKQNEHLQKLQMIGQMTSGIAHNFNNILQAIWGFADELKSKYPPNSAEIQPVDLIVTRVRGAANLISRMMSMVRTKETKYEIIELNAEITDFKSTLGHIVGENVHMNLNRSNQLLYISIDPIQLLELLSNLVSNARDAMLLRKDDIKKGGVITITTEKIKLTSSKNLIFGSIPAGEYNCIKVTDEGEGIPESRIKIIFEPFNSSKGDKGTGLGLNSVKQIMSSLKGYVDIESKVGVGTTFYLYFKAQPTPIIKDNLLINKSQSRVEKNLLPDYKQINATILLVDDEDAVRKTFQRFLERNGFKVIDASNGNTALLIFHEQKSSIDLVISDVSMPGMYGHELLAAIRQEVPDVKSILISGYTETALSSKDINTKGTIFLTKPIEPKELLEAVYKALKT